MKTQPSYVVGAALAALVLAGCATMPAVKKISGEPASGAIEYYLPKTQLIATVPIKQTVLQKPAFLPSAVKEQKEYLALLAKELKITADEVQVDDQVLYSIVKKDITLTTRGVRDAAARFEASLEAGPLSDLSLTLEFSDEQFMQSAAAEVTNQGLTVTLQAATTIAKVALMSPEWASPKTTESNPGKDTELVVEPEGTWESKTKAVIKQIQKLDDQEDAYLAKPQPNVEGSQIKQAADGIRAKRDALRLLLTGGTARETVWPLEVKFSPAAGETKIELGTLHELAGFTPAAAACGVEFETNQTLSPFGFDEAAKSGQIHEWKERKEDGALVWEGRAATETVLNLTLAVIPPAVTTDDALLGDDGSYVYRMPGRAVAAIGGGDSHWMEKEIVVAQFGQLRQLPRKLGGVHGSYTVTLDGQTGALQKITATSTAADFGKAIGTVGDIAQARHDARKAKQDAAAAAAEANSPEAKLKKERAYLEDQQAVRDLKKDLGLTDSSAGQN